MKYRILYNIFIFILISLVTWPIYTAVLLAGIFIFRKFYEAIFWLFIIEIILGPIGVGLAGHYYFLGMLLIFGILVFVKKTIRYYE